MPRPLAYLSGILIAVTLVGGPIGYALHCQAEMRNFRVVKDGVLYRSGQMTLSGLKRVVHDYGIKTIVTLRDRVPLPGEKVPDMDEEIYCKAQDIAFCRIPPREWGEQPDGSSPADEGVRKFRRIMADPANYPVLIHCFAGIHRTGAYCAVYRMEFEHWTNAEAIEELYACGYTNLYDEWDILGYLERYCPSWLPPDLAPAVERRPASKPGQHAAGKTKRVPG